MEKFSMLLIVVFTPIMFMYSISYYNEVSRSMVDVRLHDYLGFWRFMLYGMSICMVVFGVLLLISNG